MNEHVRPSLDRQLGILPEGMPSEEQANLIRRAIAALAAIDPDKPFSIGQGNGKIHECSIDGHTKIITYGYIGRQESVDSEPLEWLEYVTVRFDVPGTFQSVRFDLPHKPGIVVSYKEKGGRLVSDVHKTLKRFGSNLAFPDVETAALMGTPLLQGVSIEFAHHPLTAALCELMFYHLHLYGLRSQGFDEYTINPMGRDGVDVYTSIIPTEDLFTRACDTIKNAHPNFILGRVSDYFGTLRVELSPLEPVNIMSIPEIDTFRAMHHASYLTEIGEALFDPSTSAPK